MKFIFGSSPLILSIFISLSGLKFLTIDSFLWILKSFGFQSLQRKIDLKSQYKISKGVTGIFVGVRLMLVEEIRVNEECSRLWEDNELLF